MPKPAHYRGDYEARAFKVREAAKADPLTRCWRCGLMLHQHKRHKTGRRPFWTAGHVVSSDPRSPLLPEVSTCNFDDGARLGGQRMKAKAARRVGEGLTPRLVRRVPSDTSEAW